MNDKPTHTPQRARGRSIGLVLGLVAVGLGLLVTFPLVMRRNRQAAATGEAASMGANALHAELLQAIGAEAQLQAATPTDLNADGVPETLALVDGAARGGGYEAHRLALGQIVQKSERSKKARTLLKLTEAGIFTDPSAPAPTLPAEAPHGYRVRFLGQQQGPTQVSILVLDANGRPASDEILLVWQGPAATGKLVPAGLPQ